MSSTDRSVSLSASSGAPFLFRRGKRGERKPRRSNAAGLTSREDRPVDLQGLGPHACLHGRAEAVLLVPCAGGRSSSHPAVRWQTAFACATALPRKTAWWTHKGSVPCGFGRLTRSAVLVPDAGATMSLEFLKHCVLGEFCLLRRLAIELSDAACQPSSFSALVNQSRSTFLSGMSRSTQVSVCSGKGRDRKVKRPEGRASVR